MKQFKQSNLFIALAVCVTLASCHKDHDDTPVVNTPVSTGLYVLNQGGFNSNNASLSYYDYTSKTTVSDKFKAVNSRGLGDTGNDIGIYGSKTYITVDVSSNVEVIDTKTGKTVKQIPLFNGTGTNATKREPRWVTFYKNNALVTAYDGTVIVIDTATLTVTKSITVGANPEQMAIANGKLYVANSGGLQATPSNTVSVIDLTTLAVTKTLTVGLNPLSVAADAYGNVFVTAQGSYPTNVTTLTIINTATDVAATPASIALSYGSPFVINGDIAYYIGLDGKIKTYNVKSQTLGSANFITDGTAITTAYAITVDAASGEVFVADAGNYTSNGSVTAFDKNGKKEYSFTVGLIPGKIAIIKN